MNKIYHYTFDEKRLSESPIIVDLGFKYGEFSIPFIEKYKGICYAYEPAKTSFNIAKEKIKYMNSIFLFNEAVWKYNDIIDFYSFDNFPQSNSVFNRPLPLEDKYKIRSITLDNILKMVPYVDILKIDIEGAEWEILRLSKKELFNSVDQLIIEFHLEFSCFTLDNAIQWLKDFGFYIVSKEEECENRISVYCKKSSSELRTKTNKWYRKNLNNFNFNNVLNAGCGSDEDFEGGTYSKDYFSYKKLIKLDIDNTSKADIISSIEKTPFNDNQFDFIFSNWVIYKTDYKKSIDEFYRILQPNGYVCISYSLPDFNEVKNIRNSLLNKFNLFNLYELEYNHQSLDRKAEIFLGKKL
ncbi:MAG: FkbM family methyltransferase [Nanoarchaeota archaeon]